MNQPGTDGPVSSGATTSGSTGLEIGESGAGRSMLERFVAAIKLDPTVYEEVEHDRAALGQAAILVAAAAVAGAIGGLGAIGAAGLVGGLVQSFVSWAIWTTVVWIVGVKLLDHTSDFEELLRTLGFVAAPQLLLVLAVIPIGLWQWLVGVVVLGMTAIAFVRALRSALDIDTGRAVLVTVLALIGQGVLVAALSGVAALV